VDGFAVGSPDGDGAKSKALYDMETDRRSPESPTSSPSSTRFSTTSKVSIRIQSQACELSSKIWKNS